MSHSSHKLLSLRIILVLFPILFFILPFIMALSGNLLDILDAPIELFILSWRNEWLTTFFTTLTFFGGTWFLTTASILVGVFFWVLYKKAFFPFVLAIGGSALATKITKLALERARPEDGLITETSFSFPSGHTSNSTAFYGFLAFFLFIHLPRQWQKIALALGTIFFLCLMGISRIYLGVHFGTDVIGGYLMGGWWLALAIYAYMHKPLSH